MRWTKKTPGHSRGQQYVAARGEFVVGVDLWLLEQLFLFCCVP